MTRAATQAEQFDYNRDHRKHDWRPGDPPQHRLDVPIPMALDVALLVRAPGVSLTDAAALIEQYARTAASEAALDAVVKTSNRVMLAIEAPVDIIFGRETV
jgi:hypothetical protein